jgi:hypothetical protein
MTQALQVDRTARTVEGAKMFIGGEWVGSVDGRVFETVDPATGKRIEDDLVEQANDSVFGSSLCCGPRTSTAPSERPESCRRAA